LQETDCLTPFSSDGTSQHLQRSAVAAGNCPSLIFRTVGSLPVVHMVTSYAGNGLSAAYTLAHFSSTPADNKRVNFVN